MEVIRLGSKRVSLRGETRHLSSVGVLLISSQFPGQVGQSVEYLISIPPAQGGQPVALRCLGKIIHLNPEEGSAEISLERHEFMRNEKASRAGA